MIFREKLVLMYLKNKKFEKWIISPKWAFISYHTIKRNNIYCSFIAFQTSKWYRFKLQALAGKSDWPHTLVFWSIILYFFKSNHIIITFLMYFSDSYMIFSFNFWSNKICSLIFRSTSDKRSSRRHVWVSYNIMVNIYIFLSCLVNIFSVFLCYPIMCFYVLSSVLWCPLRFPHKMMFGYLCLFAYSGVQHILCCFVFLRVVYPVLSVSLDCPFFIALSVFSNVYGNCDNATSTWYPKVVIFI
jgi:hypothetical protein